ncbi:DHA2 family efflux MFS transporter permease subunit [Micromonospora matsumotoense]|uniref:DHA2 family efflux MFS transporter permease subunit n=1 Tax=Micromonospora matsumotoense TaxID=121616 RepID=UPI001FE0BA5C|nr:DHA2 family efflux MFS transporter permease subunit [Micromonospora matsumotoense]
MTRIKRGVRDTSTGRATLPVVLAGTFMVVLDFFIVNVAIPSMQLELRADAAQIEFVVAGYGLAYACGLITAGRLGDIYGRRRLYLLGLTLFTLASLACGLAPNAAVLVAARVVQGVAAAVLSPQVLTILGLAYTGAQRARAFNAYGMVLALASVGGQLIGGLLIAADPAGLGWRTCFLINVPIGLVALLLTPRVVPESTVDGAVRLDVTGVVLVTLGLVAIVLPLVEGRERGWPAWAWACLAASVPLLALFVRSQHRRSARGESPLVDLALFGHRTFRVGMLAVICFYSGLASFFLVLALYLQRGRGLGALGSGLEFTVMGLGFFVASFAARPIAARLGARALVVGAALLLAGQVLLAVTVARQGVGGSLAAFAPALLIDGAGLGMVMAPLNSLVLAGLPARLAGAASGVLTTTMQLGNSLGVALIGLVFYARLRPSVAESYAQALTASLYYLIALAALLAVSLVVLARKRPATAG